MRYGGIPPYLIDAGVDPKLLDAVRARLVV
jgi:hypothetical protein